MENELTDNLTTDRGLQFKKEAELKKAEPTENIFLEKQDTPAESNNTKPPALPLDLRTRINNLGKNLHIEASFYNQNEYLAEGEL